MDKTVLRNFAIESRKDLMEKIDNVHQIIEGQSLPERMNRN